jgi:hypothetical protein
MTDLPSYELVQRLMHEAGFSIQDPDKEPAFPKSEFMKLASRLIRYGADQELDACCEWLDQKVLLQHQSDVVPALRAARRPNPPSLKEQALQELNLTEDLEGAELSRTQVDLIRRAIEALPND